MRFKLERINWVLAVGFGLGILIPVLIVFKNFLLPGPLAWGDAPFFYSPGLKELIAEPLSWTNRGNAFGGVNPLIFISPLMFVYGLIGRFIGNDLAIRILFHFPALVLAIVGPVLLARYLKLSKTVWFFSSIVYTLNTYYLLLVDGGQIGIALAYGIFPFSLLFLKKLLDSPSLKSFYLSLIFLVLGSIADPRVALISIITVFIWQILEFRIRPLIYLIPLLICWLGISLYWIYPLFKNSISGQQQISSELKIVSWYDPFILFSPHWPANLFGKITRPPIYFIGVPILIFGGLFFKRNRKVMSLALVFLAFAFLASFNFVARLPFGYAFRDSTKFFVPLILFGGMLIGVTIEKLFVILQKRKITSYFLLLTFYIYLLFLIYPALLGKLNFILSPRRHSQDFTTIYEELQKENKFFRSVWFPEKHSLTYETQENPSISAKELAKFWPFASINASEDVFNFLNNANFIDRFRMLGIKYLILSDNPREIYKDVDQKKDWSTITELIDNNKNLTKMNWGTKIPVYKVSDTYPHFLAFKKLIAVIGPDPLPGANPLVPTVYFEDGKLDPLNLEGLSPESVNLVFNGTNKNDLAMSFLQKYFVSASETSKNEWAVYAKDQYLKYKYELLIRGVKFTDFDYGKGIAFSTQKGEKIEFKFKVPETGNYILAHRLIIPSDNQTNFKWETKSLQLAKGSYSDVIENNSNLQILNVAALIPEKDFIEAKTKAEVFTQHFSVSDLENLNLEDKYREVQVERRGTLKYKFIVPKGFKWIIFSENYHPLWKLRNGVEYFNSVPIYSMINGFYVENKWSDLGIEFKGQENFRWGMYWSAIWVLTLSIIYLWFSPNEKKEV